MTRLPVRLTVLLIAGSLNGSVWAQPPPDQADHLGTGTGSGSTSTCIGPVQVYSADSSALLRFQFAGQLRTDWENKDEGDERAAGIHMQARRVRPTVIVSLPQQDILFRLHLSTAPGSLELMDMYVNATIGQLQFRAGQYKVPFTRYRIQSFQRLTFTDWALVSRYFGAERQMGFSLHNGYEKPPELAYAIGVFSGLNARASSAIGLPKVFGEETVNPSDLANPGPRARFHPELVGHFSYNPGGIQVRSDSDDKGGSLRYSLGISLAWDIDPDEFQDLAFRAAPELLIKYRGASFMTAAYSGFVPVDNSLRTRLAFTGLLVQTSLRLNHRCELSARYALVDIADAVLENALARATQLIGDAQQQLLDSTLTQQDVDDLKKRYSNAGQTLREQEATIGFNLYLREHSLKWQNDVGWLKHSLREGDSLNDIIVRSQFQIAF